MWTGRTPRAKAAAARAKRAYYAKRMAAARIRNFIRRRRKASYNAGAFIMSSPKRILPALKSMAYRRLIGYKKRRRRY